MKESKSQIECHVGNCKYNQSDYCTADKVEVAPQNGSFSNSSYDTVCSTFVPKDL